MILVHMILVGAFALILFMPAWWLAGRILESSVAPFFRFLCTIGVALVGYLTFVNLLGRLIGNSITAVIIYLTLNAIAGVFAWRRWPAELSISPLLSTWRSWIVPVAIALALGIPQWILAVSTNFFDEAASSAIHLTGANQFAEGVFPPRHNALPDVAIKYHYAFIILSGTVRLITGLSANVSIDVVSTSLWLFILLFVYFWLSKLDLGRFAATWGAFSILLGGGLAWLYLRRIEAYDGVEKVPPPSQMINHYDPAKSWLGNLIADGRVPGLHLRNLDGSLSALPWDIAAGFQQHAVSLGTAVVVVALFLFVTWHRRPGLEIPLLVANILAFSVLFLAHSVFGAVGALTAGICLLISWLRERTRWRFYRGLFFGLGVAIVAPLHGGLLARGAQYGGNAVTTLRSVFGYPSGGLSGFIHWNVAGFGLPLFLTLLAWAVYLWRRAPAEPVEGEDSAGRKRRRSKAKTNRQQRLFSPGAERDSLFFALSVFALLSYFVPQLTFYSSETIGVEQFTEIAKFFFCAHFALALLSAFAVSWIVRSVHWGFLLPGYFAMALSPLAFLYAGSFRGANKWVGFYHSPYYVGSLEEQAGKALEAMKTSNHDVYFDASADERVHGYLGELLIFGGSVFTLTPSRYERTGIGYRIAESVVAKRFVQNSRMARLLPGAAEDCDCKWYYSRPFDDMARSPLIVRSRFAKMLGEGYLRNRFQGGARTLFSIDKSTSDLDYDLATYWRPRIISQTHSGKGEELAFFDIVNRRILIGSEVIEPPQWMLGELSQPFVAHFAGDAKPDFVFGRMEDTYFHLGKRIEEVVEQSKWAWTSRDSRTGDWQPESEYWLWDWDMPIIADVLGSGAESQIAYRPRTGEWLLAPGQQLSGPKVDEKDLPVPFSGRFLPGSRGDLGLWSLRSGIVTLQTIATGQKVEFKWGGTEGDILVPGDYDGDGYDEIAVWQRRNHTWYWRHAPDGPIAQVAFGTDTSIPLPADYNHDGKLDIAYWEPREGKIYVSYTQGRSVELVIPVPEHSVPAFVNLY